MRSLDWRLRRRALPRRAYGVGAFANVSGMEAAAYVTAPERHVVPSTGAALKTPAVVHVELDPGGTREVLDPLQTIAQ